MRHEIVHNKQVVENLKKKGAIFIDELNQIKDCTRPVIFSAHGVPKSVPKEAESKKIFYVDMLKETKKIRSSKICLKLPDGVHLSKKGAKIYGKIIFKKVKKML